MTVSCFRRSFPPFDTKHNVVYICVMRAKRKRANFYLAEDQLKRLKELSEKTGAPQSELLRRAIEDYLRKNRS